MKIYVNYVSIPLNRVLVSMKILAVLRVWVVSLNPLKSGLSFNKGKEKMIYGDIYMSQSP